MVLMGFMAIFEIGNAEAAKEMMVLLANLFTPITSSWAVIVSASFGVNAKNVIKKN